MRKMFVEISSEQRVLPRSLSLILVTALVYVTPLYSDEKSNFKSGSEPMGYEVTLKIYPDAYHDFDWAGMDKVVKGHKVKFNARATDDAILRVKRFFSYYLQPEN